MNVAQKLAKSKFNCHIFEALEWDRVLHSPETLI